MKKIIVFGSLLGLLVSSLGALGGRNKNSAYTIEISGSTTVYPLMELLEQEYRTINPDVSINVNGTGSSDGIKAANTGTSELGMASRNLKTEEKGFGLDELAIAFDGITPVVHPSNPLESLTPEQIRDIYTGSVTRWEDISEGKSGPIAVVSREPGSGTRGAFEDIVGFRDQLVRGASEFDGNGGVKAAVVSNPDAIGYLSLGFLDSSVKGLSVDGVKPTEENVSTGDFPIARPLLVLYHGNEISGQTREFLDWIMSPDGQQIAATNWVPARNF